MHAPAGALSFISSMALSNCQSLEIMVFGIVLNVAAGVGALIFGFVDDRIGSKSTVQISLLGLTAASLIAVFTV